MTDQKFTQAKFEEVFKKVEEMKKSGAIDLSMEEDLAVGVMNLVSLEEHFFFTAERTGKSGYFDLLNEVRQVRKDLLGRLIDQHEGETWCVSKHLLGTTMRLMEVGTKLQQDGKKDEAKKIFDHAYKLFSLFWALRLKLIDTAGLKQTAASDQPWTMQDIVNKLANCCNE